VLAASLQDGEIAWYEAEITETTVDPEDGEPVTVVQVDFTKHLIAADAAGAVSVVAGDLDTDGDLDVVAAARNLGALLWYESDGATPPAFAARVVATGVPGANAVHLAQVDAGGLPDVLAASSLAGTFAAEDEIAWHRNDGGVPLAFTRQVVAASAIAPGAVAVADVDSDGDDDVLAGSLTENRIAWYESDGTSAPAFTEREISLDLEQPSALFWADVDGDGLGDLLAAGEGDDTIAWYRNDGLSPPGFTGFVISTAAEGASAVFAADLDADDDADVLSASSVDGKIAWDENDGNAPPAFTERAIATDAAGAGSIFAVDFDDDGDVDVLATASAEDRIVWYENDGSAPPSFTERLIATDAAGARAVTAADVDQDGDLEAVAASSDDDTVAWYERVDATDDDGLPIVVWVEHAITTSADFVRALLVADVDEDGDPDVVAASSSDDTVAWYERTITNDFVEHPISTEADAVRAIAAGDLDGDGHVDVVAGFQFAVDWHRGHAAEVCPAFDADGDDRIDGVELAWMAKAFGEVCFDPSDPAAEWWSPVDYEPDCQIDGDDLSVLTSSTVWGETAASCQFTCR
jgi:hypothetical protein